MRTTVRLLLAFAIVGLAAGAAQAHMIGIRGGGGSMNLCNDSLDTWLDLEADEDDPEGVESIVNNCGVSIYSLDIQLSDFGDEESIHDVDDLELDPSSIFDVMDVLDGPGLVRLSNSQNLSIVPCPPEPGCPPDPDSIDFLALSLLASSVMGPHFEFFLTSDTGDPGFFRIVGFGTEPLNEVVPEPATLLLLGTGLVGAGLRSRRRK